MTTTSDGAGSGDAPSVGTTSQEDDLARASRRELEDEGEAEVMLRLEEHLMSGIADAGGAVRRAQRVGAVPAISSTTSGPTTAPSSRDGVTFRAIPHSSGRYFPPVPKNTLRGVPRPVGSKTCWLGSQVMTSSASATLVSGIEHGKTSSPIFAEMDAELRRLRDPRSPSAWPKALVEAFEVGHSHIRRDQAHDAGEEVQRLLSTLQIGGTETVFAVVGQCLDCQRVTEDVEQLHCLTVGLRAELVDGLQDFIRASPAKCPACGSSRVATTRSVLKFPQTLVVVLDSVDPATGAKRQQPCRTPRFLEASSPNGNRIYRLVSLAFHTGLNGPTGHWTAARLDHDNMIRLYDDSRVLPTSSFEDAASQASTSWPATPGLAIYELGHTRSSDVPPSLSPVLPGSTISSRSSPAGPPFNPPKSTAACSGHRVSLVHGGLPAAAPSTSFANPPDSFPSSRGAASVSAGASSAGHATAHQPGTIERRTPEEIAVRKAQAEAKLRKRNMQNESGARSREDIAANKAEAERRRRAALDRKARAQQEQLEQEARLPRTVTPVCAPSEARGLDASCPCEQAVRAPPKACGLLGSAQPSSTATDLKPAPLNRARSSASPPPPAITVSTSLERAVTSDQPKTSAKLSRYETSPRDSPIEATPTSEAPAQSRAHPHHEAAQTGKWATSTTKPAKESDHSGAGRSRFENLVRKPVRRGREARRSLAPITAGGQAFDSVISKGCPTDDPAWDFIRAEEQRMLNLKRRREARESVILPRFDDPAAKRSDVLLEILNGRYAESKFPLPPLTPGIGAWSLVEECPALIDFLAHLVRHPFRLPPVSAEIPKVAGDLSSRTNKSSPELSSSKAVQVYIRFPTLRTVSLAISLVTFYGNDYYADLPWASSMLTGLCQLAETGYEGEVTIAYPGITVGGTPGGRLDADRLVEESRNTNFMAAIQRWSADQAEDDRVRFELRELLPFRSETDDPLAANQRDIASREEIVIAAASSFSSNSARGGRRLALDPKPFEHFREQLAGARALPEQLDTLAPIDDDDKAKEGVVELVKKHCDDVLQFWQQEPDLAGTTIDVETEGGSKAFERLVAAATAFKTRARRPGEPHMADVITLGKDIPLTSALGHESFFGREAGRGPWAGWLIARLVRGLPEDDDVGWLVLSAYIDLWSVQLRHFRVREAVILLLRFLVTVRPRIAITHSSKMSSVLRRGLLADCLDLDDPDKASAIEAFLSMAVDTTLNALEAIAPDTKAKSVTWQELWTNEWIDSVGTIEVVECGLAGPILHVSQLDPGMMKYTPKVQDLSVRLFACVETEIGLLVECELAIRLEEGPPKDDEQRRQHYHRVIERTKARLHSSGNAAELEEARSALSVALSSFASLQKTAAADRAGRECFEGPPLSREELLAFLDDVTPAKAEEDEPLINLSALEGDDRPRVQQLLSICQTAEGVPARLSELGLHSGTVTFAAWFVQREEGESFGRAAESELRRQLQLVVEQEKREKRAQTNMLPGTMSTLEALEMLREDQVRTVDDSTSRATKKANRTDRYRDLTITVCGSCGENWIHMRDKFIDSSRDMHACAKPEWLSTRPLFTASLLHLLPTRAEDLRNVGPSSLLPKFCSVKVRDVLPSQWLQTLPWQDGLEAEITLPQSALASSLPEIGITVIVAALDRLVIDRVSTERGGAESMDMIRAMDTTESTAWGGGGGAQSNVNTARMLVNGDEFFTAFCSKCDWTSPAAGPSRRVTHTCPATNKKRMTRITGADHQRLNTGSSFADLPVDIQRRVLYGFARAYADDEIGTQFAQNARDEAGKWRMIRDALGRLLQWRQPKPGSR